MKKIFVMLMILFAITACSSINGGKNEVKVGVGF